MRYTVLILTAFSFFFCSSAAAIDDSATLEELSAELFEIHSIHPANLLQNAAHSYMEGDYDKAAEYFVMSLMTDLNNNPIILYNLACCYGLLDEPELAGKTLVQSAVEGFDRLELVEVDTDFSLVRDDEVFIEYLAEAEAVADENKELQSVAVLGERFYLDFPSVQTARIHLPDNYDPMEEYDLVIALHGYGGDVSEFSSRWTVFDEGDFILVSLQAPYAFLQGGRTVYSWAVHGSGEWERTDMLPEQKRVLLVHSLELSSSMVLAFMDALQSEYRIGSTYLLGFSQGGIMSYWTGLNNPSCFAGIATFSGVIDEELFPEDVIESSSTIPIFIGRGTGEDDRAINARDLLLDNSYNVTYFEYDGGHHIPDEGFRAVENWISGME